MDWFIFTLGVVVTSMVTAAILLVGKMEDRTWAALRDSRPADPEGRTP
jgi:hypothetical protein